MLPDRYHQLLTAYVDGELGNRQRKHVLRLLKRSAEARTLLLRLKKDSAAVAGLSTPKLDLDLTASVLSAIHTRRLMPSRRKPRPLAPAFPAWVGIAIAASVLCAISLGSYIGFAAFFSKPAHHGGDDTIAKKDQPEVKPDRPAHVVEPEKPALVHNDTPTAPREFVGPLEQKDAPSTAVVKVAPPIELHGPPEPMMLKEGVFVVHLAKRLGGDFGVLFHAFQGMWPEPIGPVLTSPALERFKPEMVVGAAAKRVIVKLHDLDQDAPRKKLFDELTQDSGFRLELPCSNGTKAFDRLQATCKNQKIAMLIDLKAQQRLKAPQAQTNYALYVENVTPEELGRLVQQLGAEDKKAAAKKSTDARFDSLVVTRLTKLDYKELSDLLGVDPSKVEAPKSMGPLGTDLSKPLSEQTADQIAKSLVGGKPAPKAAEAHQALVLAYNPVLPPKNSPEVKKFLDGRKPAKPGTVRAIIVLRSM